MAPVDNEQTPIFSSKFIPFLFGKYPTFWTLAEASTDIEKTICSLIMAAYLVRGEYEDYEDATFSQSGANKLSFATFQALANYFSVFKTKPYLYSLVEIYTIALDYSSTKEATDLVKKMPHHPMDLSNDFRKALFLVQNRLIPETKGLSLGQFDILTSAFVYAAKAKQTFLINDNVCEGFNDIEERIIYAYIICNFAARSWDPKNGGTLSLTETAAQNFLKVLSRHKNFGSSIEWLALSC